MTESMMEVGHVRLMIVDDHAVLRRGVVASLSEFADIEVVAEAGAAKSFWQCARSSCRISGAG